MSHATIISWLPMTTNLAAIAPLQTIAAAGNLVLNSSIVGEPFGPYIYDKVIRKVSLTSTSNLAGVQFTITGLGSPVDRLGNPTKVLSVISENLNGPNNNTVQSANIYSRIISISTNNAVAGNGVSAGFGVSGITDYVFLDYNRKFFQASVQLQFVARNTLTASVFQTLTKPEYINIDYGNLEKFAPFPAFLVTATFPLFADIIDVTANQLGNLLSPVTMTWANMAATAADSLYFTVLQQGIN